MNPLMTQWLQRSLEEGYGANNLWQMLEFASNTGSLTVHQERFVIRTRQPGIDTQGASSRKARMRFSLRLSNKVPRNKKHLIT